MSPPKTVTRADLVEAVARKADIQRSDATALVTDALDQVVASLTQGDHVKLSRFGNFVVRSKRKRVGRNPKTGEEVPITPRRVVTFRPSQLLRERVEAAKLRR
ncbi:MAG: integration host factor subunit alpha [Alphaproteobacteria bacterium]|nr:integration host factor subunit alpha [Alphaproteobacteria bacterium]